MKNSSPRYASYTYDHPNFLVRFPHRKRNKLVAENMIKISAASWLDFGAGDGALLSDLLEKNALPASIVCYEPNAAMCSELADNISKLAESAACIRLTSAISEINAQFDLVTALEVLEHLPLPERIKFYCLLTTKLNKAGVVLIEVPVEYGPILLLKEWGRKFLKKRTSEYSSHELANAAFFGKIFDAYSRYRQDDDRTFISPHRGFDLKRLLVELNSIGNVREVVRSPFPFLPRIFNQSILFSFELRVWDASKIEERVFRINENPKLKARGSK